MPKLKANLCQLKVTIVGAEPPIWRRLFVPGDIRLGKLHEVIQVVMGWTNSHLHMFEAGGRKLSLPDPEWNDVEDERKVQLRDIAPKAGDKFVYEYDMGDSCTRAGCPSTRGPARGAGRLPLGGMRSRSSAWPRRTPATGLARSAWQARGPAHPHLA